MAYTTKTPVLICANLFHYGTLSGTCELKIPKGWNKLKILTTKNEKIIVNCGVKDNYNVGGAYAPNEIISVPTDYNIIPDSIFIKLASSTTVSIEVIENKGVASPNYFEKMNNYLYSEIMGNPVEATPRIGTFEADGTTRYSFSVPDGFLTYQWQISTNNGETWNNSTSDGATTRTISGVMQANFDGRMFRCIVTDSFETQIISNPVLLKVSTENNSKAPTIEELENDKNVVKIEVDKEEAKEIFDNVSRETLNEKEE